MPVIWNTFMAVTMGISLQQIGKGAVGSPYIPSPFPLPPPQPEYLFIFPSNLTCDDKFTVQMTVIPTAEANVGFRLHFAPPDGEPLDFENGDLFFSFHLRWHFDYGPSKEIAFNDRYNGEWSRPEVTVGGNLWPNVTAGERFIVSTSKAGPCFVTFVILGDDMHLAVPIAMEPLVFCPKVPVTGDPRKLWLTVNEDKQGAKEVIVQWVTWMPSF
ncbi:uncharacterized protein LOC126992996 [Eriocheir sinensis]|uniref:uncharacterized protein LOC126992996 n=1 Tax=Eriocheir sinensis TaxID=95602 RepID=UPI0021CAD2C3|nr:uncharacterized protein LOC126992996 [Eriocheir sinensis]